MDSPWTGRAPSRNFATSPARRGTIHDIAYEISLNAIGPPTSHRTIVRPTVACDGRANIRSRDDTQFEHRSGDSPDSNRQARRSGPEFTGRHRGGLSTLAAYRARRVRRGRILYP